MTAGSDISARLDELRARLEPAIARLLLPPDRELVPQLKAALEYAVFSGGKRLRPLLCLLVNHACRGREEDAIAAAVALELIHCYSLVHDDLPAMDDDDTRRGRPTCHKVHGEALAILAGDALLTRAFEIVARHAPAAHAAAIAAEIGAAAGVSGMVGGQAADLLGEGKKATEADVRFIHARKTAALFRAAASVGARTAGASADLVAAAARYGEELGLAFQVVDDLLGKSGDPRQTGKPVGKDDERGKLTYPAAVGEAEARTRVQALTESARRQAAAFPQPDELAALALELKGRLA